MMHSGSVAGSFEKTALNIDRLPNAGYSPYWRAEVPVVIDGNNLLHAARTVQEAGPLIGRAILCDTLGQWAKQRGERVHIVFDGPAPNPQLAGQIGNPAIEVSYSGGASADAVLIEMLETDSAARRMLVVSSDREVVRAARRRRAQPIRSEEFWALVRQDLARPRPVCREPEEKKRGLKPGATEEWLRDFGLNPLDAAAGEE